MHVILQLQVPLRLLHLHAGTDGIAGSTFSLQIEGAGGMMDQVSDVILEFWGLPGNPRSLASLLYDLQQRVADTKQGWMLDHNEMPAIGQDIGLAVPYVLGGEHADAAQRSCQYHYCFDVEPEGTLSRGCGDHACKTCRWGLCENGPFNEFTLEVKIDDVEVPYNTVKELDEALHAAGHSRSCPLPACVPRA
jgi:hypothetical protein